MPWVVHSCTVLPSSMPAEGSAGDQHARATARGRQPSHKAAPQALRTAACSGSGVQNLQTLFHEGLANKHASFPQHADNTGSTHRASNVQTGTRVSRQLSKRSSQQTPNPTPLSLSSVGSDLGTHAHSLNLESDAATSTFAFASAPAHTSASAARAGLAANPTPQAEMHTAGLNPLFSDFDIADLPDKVITQILSMLLESDFPGAVWSGRLTPQRRHLLLASAFHAGPHDMPAILRHFSFDGRPNDSTRDVLAASQTCKRWQRLVRNHVIKHCAIFGSTPVKTPHAEGASSTHESAQQGACQFPCQGCSNAAASCAQGVQRRPRMNLTTFVAVVSDGLPVGLSGLGVPTRNRM